MKLMWMKVETHMYYEHTGAKYRNALMFCIFSQFFIVFYQFFLSLTNFQKITFLVKHSVDNTTLSNELWTKGTSLGREIMHMTVHYSVPLMHQIVYNFFQSET